MPKPRNAENRGLPARWQHVHGAFYYRVPPGREDLWDGKRKFLLGKTLPAAYKVWAERLETPSKCATIGQLLDRYLLEVVPTKAPTTQSGNIIFIKRLRRVFGAIRLTSVKPRHIYQYVDRREKKTSAHREIEVLSHAFTKAVEWGYIDKHPFKGEVRLAGEAPRTRYVEDWEVVECLSLPASRTSQSVLVVRAYISIKLLTGMGRGDLLRLEPGRHIQEDGIHIQRHKTAKSSGKRTVYEWTDELRLAIAAALAARPVDISPYLFCTRKGESYVNEITGEAPGWKSLWQRFMARVLAETKVAEHFTEHDLRAKCASDATTLEHARALLSHADGRTTERIYRRKPERVRPLR